MPSTLMKSKPLQLLLGSVLAGLLMLALAGQASAKPYYRIVNVNSGKALQVENHSKAFGAKIVQANVAPAGAQTWFVRHVGGYAGLYVWEFENRNSHLCMHPSDWSGKPGTHVGQASCTNDSSRNARQWATTTATNKPIWYGDQFKMFSMQSFSYVAIDGASQSPGARLIQWPWQDASHFEYRLIYAGETS